MSLKLRTTKRRRILYSSRMRSISPSHSFRAVMAAYWLVVGALMMALWWILVMILMTASGPQA